MIGRDNSQTRSPWGVQVKQLTKICWHLTCSPIQPRLLGRGSFNLALAWLLSVAVVKLHDGDLHAVGWGPRALVTPVKAIRVGMGLKNSQ